MLIILARGIYKFMLNNARGTLLKGAAKRKENSTARGTINEDGGKRTGRRGEEDQVPLPAKKYDVEEREIWWGIFPTYRR